ncbi:MAG TPA: hypothetical protein VJY39_16235 [Acidisphaera sp.]|nr:hypothetical protein [Acidisphaera sp.]
MKSVLLVGLTGVSLCGCGVNLPTVADQPVHRTFQSRPISLTNNNAPPYATGPSGTLRAGPLSPVMTNRLPSGGSQIVPGFGQQAAPVTDVDSYPTTGTGVQAYGSGSRLPQ